MINVVNKDIKSKRKSNNHVHNTLRLFDGLANFPFTTSDTKCVISDKLVYTSCLTS